jgi:hypothetical protein
MILEARQRTAYAGIELALEQHVADHALLACDRLERKQADPGHVLSVEAAIAASEELIAAAHREQRGASFQHGLLQRFGLRGKVRCHAELLSVLAAADVIEVVRPGNDRVVNPSGVTSSSCPRARVRSAKTAMLPRSA